MNSKILSFHGGHNCSVTFVDKNNQLRIFELERFTKIKNDTFEYSNCNKDSRYQIKKNFLDHIKTQLKEDPQYVLYSYISNEYLSLVKSYFRNSKFIEMGHHTSHCIGAYYQSGFEDALVISMDGGGREYQHYGISKDPNGIEITYSILRINNNVEVISTTNSPDALLFTPGTYTAIVPLISEIDPYNSDTEISKYIDEAQKDESDIQYRDLEDSPFWRLRSRARICAGKLMGLSSYGNVREEWIDAIKNIYLLLPDEIHQPQNMKKSINGLSKSIGKYLSQNCLSGQDSYDLAATNQHVFEELCWELIKPYLDQYDLDIVLSGGCALNVVFNQKLGEYLKSKNKKLFISPTPSDEGLSYGHVCSVDKTINDKFSVYCGLDILDRENISYYYDKYDKDGKVVKL
jgi:predicted NodU family carbamoyl transferase